MSLTLSTLVKGLLLSGVIFEYNGDIMPLKEPTSRLIPRRPTQRYRYVRLRWHLLFAVVDAIGGVLFAPAKLFKAVLHGRADTDPSLPPVRKILVLQLDHLGDAILSTGMLHVLRQRYPEAQIDVLVGPWNRQLFEAMVPDVDRVLVFQSGGRLARAGSARWPCLLKKLSPLRKMAWPLAMGWQAWRLRAERYDLGIDVRGEMPHAAMMWLARIRRRVGWRAGGGGFLLTDSPRWMHDRPEIESRGAILKAIGLEAAPEELLPRLEVDDEVSRRVFSEVLPGFSNTRGQAPPLTTENISEKSYIALHLGAGTRAKAWPVGYWATLIDELAQIPSPEIVLVGSPADHIIGQNVEDLVTSDRRRLHNLIGRLSLVELGSVLQGARWMIGTDSGPAHMAAAVGTRTIVLFSGTNLSEQWHPPGEQVTVLKHEVPCRPCHQKQDCPVEGHPCMAGITPQQVIKEVREERREGRGEQLV